MRPAVTFLKILEVGFDFNKLSIRCVQEKEVKSRFLTEYFFCVYVCARDLVVFK